MEYIVKLKEEEYTITVKADSNNVADKCIKFFLNGEFVIMFNLDEVVYIANKKQVDLSMIV